MMLWVFRAHDTNLWRARSMPVGRADAAIADAPCWFHLADFIPWIFMEVVVICFAYFAGYVRIACAHCNVQAT